MTTSSSSVAAVAESLFDTLARTFPIACASDEFYYFPQVRLPEPPWKIYDQFSGETVAEIVRQLSGWENELDRLTDDPVDLPTQIDIALLQKLVRTLREQLVEVRTWESQPSFYLTLACLGLAEALETEDPAAKHDRAGSLPDFLDQASRNLQQIPVLFQEIGLEMVADTRAYFGLLHRDLPELKHALSALDRFERALRKVSTREDVLLPRELLERIYAVHIHCEMTPEEVDDTLDREIAEMQQILEQEVRKFVSDRSTAQSSQPVWLQALQRIPVPAVGEAGIIGLYKDEVHRLAKHCLDQGLVTSELFASCPVRVTPVPQFLSAIRTASSYSIPPKHPPAGGVFYIINAHVPEEAQQGYHREYKMLTAHETYPGHHLLDASRWNLAQPLRRVVEQPIFYEGWACFAEEIMRQTGYFSAPGDRLMLAKRRLWRAIRGKLDVGLQTGTMTIPTAAKYLQETGIGMQRALSSTRKYLLNPGYQVCYTIGLRRFLDLFDQYGRETVQAFVQTVLAQGEIHFRDLEKILKHTHLRSANVSFA